MKKSLLALALVSSALFASTASAMDVPSFYGSVGVTQSQFNLNTGGVPFENSGTGGTAALGASFNKTFAAEVSYSDFGSRTVGAGQYTDNLKTSQYGVHAVASYPVAEKVSVFVKPGIVRTRAKFAGESIEKTQFDIGVGAQYAVTKNVAVIGELHRVANFADSDASNVALTAGVKFNF